MDRIFRSARDALETVDHCMAEKINLVLFDMGVQPVTADEGMSRMFFTMLAAFAEFERGRIRERMIQGKAAKARTAATSAARRPTATAWSARAAQPGWRRTRGAGDRQLVRERGAPTFFLERRHGAQAERAGSPQPRRQAVRDLSSAADRGEVDGAMIRMFDTFRRWCTENGVPSDQIEITVTPLGVEAAGRFETAWFYEMQKLTVRPSVTELPAAGRIYDIPFRYKRPRGPDSPFGNTKG
jgi:hypothetical protein